MIASVWPHWAMKGYGIPMSTEVHGHAVLEMMLEADAPFSRAALIERVYQEFGPDARFGTCSGSGMTIDELLEFLAERGKISESQGAIVVHGEEICGH